MLQPRAGVAWDVRGNGTSVLRGSAGIYFARQNMLSQVGTVTTNGLQQQTISRTATFATSFARHAGVARRRDARRRCPPGSSRLFSGMRVFDKDYENPRIYAYNVAYEQELAPDLAGYVDFTWNEGRDLTRFLNYNRSGPSCCDQGPGTGNVYVYSGTPWGPQLGEVMVTNSRGESRYRGLTLGIRKRLVARLPVRGATTCWPRTKTTTRTSAIRSPIAASTSSISIKDWGPADRDIRHKFNAFGYFALPQRLQLERARAVRAARSRSPPARAVLNGVDRGRNSERKDNEFFTFDWRLARPFRFGGRYEIMPMIEMFNTFNNANNINPLSTPALFNFDGFLRSGVGDPRQVQLAVKVSF